MIATLPVAAKRLAVLPPGAVTVCSNDSSAASPLAVAATDAIADAMLPAVANPLVDAILPVALP